MLDLRLPVMILGGLPFNTIKTQLGNDKSDEDHKMLEACLNQSWIGVLRDLGTVRARLLTALANDIIDMRYSDDYILHFTFSNPKFQGLDIDFNSRTFDDIGFDFEQIGKTPEELLRYVLYLFRESLPHLQKEWNFSDEYISYLLGMLDVYTYMDNTTEYSYKDLADIYYVNRNRLPWKLFMGNKYGFWEYHYGKDGRTFMNYNGEQVVATKTSPSNTHVFESTRAMGQKLIEGIIGKKGANFEVKYDESYFTKVYDNIVEDRAKYEAVMTGVDAAVEKAVDIVKEAEVKAVQIETPKPAVSKKANKKKGTAKETETSTENKAIEKTDAVELVAVSVKAINDIKVEEPVEDVDVELIEDIEDIEDIEGTEAEETEVVTRKPSAIRKAVSVATREFMQAEARAEKRFNSTAIDNMLTSRATHVHEKLESSEELQSRYIEAVGKGNSLIVVDCENAKVETIWGNIFKFVTKTTQKGKKGKLWLNAKLLFVHDADPNECADWASMINVFKSMVVTADTIEDVKVNCIKSEKAKSLTDVALGVHVGRIVSHMNTDIDRTMIIISSDSDMSGVIQACRCFDKELRVGVCYSEESSGRGYRTWCHTNGVCTFDADKYDGSNLVEFKKAMFDHIYEERYRQIVAGTVDDMFARMKGGDSVKES